MCPDRAGNNALETAHLTGVSVRIPSKAVNTLLRSDEFDAWLAALKDKVGRARIIHRIRAAEHGNFGDCEAVGGGVSEMRVHVGPGYRVYFTRRGEVVYLLLLGGNKSSQQRDIQRAIEMAHSIGKESS